MISKKIKILVLRAILTVTFCGSAGPSFAQTTRMLYTDSTGNNIGIGTTTPQAAFVVTNGNVGIGTWTAASGRLIVSGGNVGIGTAVPGSTFEVKGGANQVRILSSSGTEADIHYIPASGSSWQAGAGSATNNSWSVYEDGGATSAFIIKEGGNVGIGTTNAAFKFTTLGSISSMYDAGSYIQRAELIAAQDTTLSRTVGQAYLEAYRSVSASQWIPWHMRGSTIDFTTSPDNVTGAGGNTILFSGTVFSPASDHGVDFGSTVLRWSDSYIYGGLIVGNSPTGGNKGSGTINIAGDIYKNNTAYTNPDYVFEKYFTGKIVKFKDKPGASTYTGLKPLSDVMQFASRNSQLPLVAATKGGGLFDRGDGLLASLEEAYLYIFDMDKRLQDLQKDNAGLAKDNAQLKARLETLEKREKKETQ